jgi:hypothetical protein
MEAHSDFHSQGCTQNLWAKKTHTDWMDGEKKRRARSQHREREEYEDFPHTAEEQRTISSTRAGRKSKAEPALSFGEQQDVSQPFDTRKFRVFSPLGCDQINGTAHVDVNKIHVARVVDQLHRPRHGVAKGSTNLAIWEKQRQWDDTMSQGNATIASGHFPSDVCCAVLSGSHLTEPLAALSFPSLPPALRIHPPTRGGA